MKTLFLLLPLLFATSGSGACLPVTGDRILGRDLALAEPKFSALPPSLQIGYTPVPGVARTFAVAELQRLARSNGISASDLAEVCFEMPMHPPADTEFIESMRRSLPPAASLHLVEMGRAPIPIGKIEFPLSGLEPPPSGGDGAQLWRGFVQYTDTRRLTVWARVSLTASYATVITRHDLPAGTPIDATALLLENRTGQLSHIVNASRIEDVTGRVLQRPLKSGAEIPLSLLEEAPAVRRGDSVNVEVQSGLAILRFNAIAQNTARAGEITELRNSVTGKLFRARIGAGSKAVVVVGSSPTL